MVRNLTRKEMLKFAQLLSEPFAWFSLVGETEEAGDDIRLSYCCRQCGRVCKVLIDRAVIDQYLEYGDLELFFARTGYLARAVVYGLCPSDLLEHEHCEYIITKC